MNRTFNAKIQLEVSVAPCKKVWLEKQEVPLSLEVKALFKALNPQGEDPDYQEMYYLRWGEEGKKRKVDLEEAAVEMLNIASRREAIDIIRLIYFWQEVGPLFSGNIISLNEALSKIMFGVLLIGVKASTEKEKPGMPPHIRPTQLGIIDVLKEKVLEQPEIKKWTWLFLDTGLFPEMIPASKNSWPVFVVPDKWPADREDIIEYARQEVRRNVLARLQRITPEFTAKGEFIIRPASLYDAIIVWHCLENPKVIGKKDIATRVKQDVLTYFRNYKYRKEDPLSDEAWEIIVKPAISQAWKSGVRNKGALKEVGYTAMQRVARSRK